MTSASDKKSAGAVAPDRPEGDDVRVPVTDGNTEAEEAQAPAEGPAVTAADPGSVELDEETMVAEAIRRGEQAAADDLKADLEAADADRAELARKLAEAEEAVAAAEQKAADAVERQARLRADWDNYRRRTASERLAERELANQRLVGNLLPVIDDMERAVSHAVSGDDVPEALRQFADGVSAVRAKMLDILGQDGVEAFDPTGEAFDPQFHQAVGRVEDADAFEGTVRDVYQLGYKMAGKVIRPAMVTVTFGGKARPAVEPEPAEGGVAEAPEVRDTDEKSEQQ